MTITLRPLAEQTIVITGASSGIGLVTALEAAQRGACVVLAARNEQDLAAVVAEIRRSGGRAVSVVTDVADESRVEALADRAIAEFGRIDTWVNNAAVSLYGRVMDVPTQDLRRQMDVNYWGYVYGSRAAVRRMRVRGGALINVASALSDRAIPLQGNYCAAKHAIKAFTDALRMELEEEGAPISVTLVKPASIDTPFFEKARTFLGVEPQPVPPVYAPEVVTDVILEAAQRPIRERLAGGAGAKISAARLAPRLADRYMERWTFASQATDVPVSAARADNLYAPLPSDGGARGRNWRGHTRESSLVTAAMSHPHRALAAGAVLASILAAFALAGRQRGRLGRP
jgi:NAD(P)-dependent dehydrogenase (short-subunit alcohol dehydrogenase family)